jgi:hypothetical protein
MEQKVAYKLSVVAGGLFYREAIKLLELYLDLHDWSQVREKAISENILRARTQSSAIRTTREVIQRLQVLTEEQLYLLAEGSRQEQNQILWLAVCKQYPFVREFAVDVLREKYLRLDLEISYPDFDRFYNAKAEWNDSLAQITELTRKKLRQVLFRIMTEAEIITQAGMILPMILSPRVAQAINHDDPAYWTIYPISDGDIQK